MKKIILISFILISVVCGKSVEEIQNEWQQKIGEKMQEQYETYWQNEEVATLMPHCQSGDNSACRKLSKEAKKSCQKWISCALRFVSSSLFTRQRTIGYRCRYRKSQSLCK